MRRKDRGARGEQGSATIEFALVSLFLFGVILVALDFGFYAQQKLRLGRAVEQAALLAFNGQASGASLSTTLSSFVQSAAGTMTSPTITVTCNGTSTCGDGKCSCPTASGGFTVATCTTACSSGGLSGNYLKIAASLRYTAVIVPDRYLGGSTLTQSAVVRLP